MLSSARQKAAAMALTALLFASTSARADIFDESLDILTAGFDILMPGDFTFDKVSYRLGGGIGIAPDYLGAGHYEPRVLPLLDLNYRDIVRLTGTELKIRLHQRGSFLTGVSTRYRFGRNEADSSKLMGLGDVGNSFELGGFAEWRKDHMLLRFKISGDIAGGHNGVTAVGHFEHGLWSSNDDRLGISAGTTVTWASGGYTRSLFGVTREQSLKSGLAEYTPGSGLRDITARLTGRYRLNDNWHIVSLARVGFLLSEAGDSPLVQSRGSSTQILFGTGIYYSF